jgi:sugar O-acyltransferase (sialic acid O-acetyltransferase NeuD family)
MSTLYLCGAGNAEGVRLALRVNKTTQQWEEIVLLDDDPAKHGQSILGVKIIGPFTRLAEADPARSAVANLVARTTTKRLAALRSIQGHKLPFAPLIDPSVDVLGVEFGSDITVYQNATFSAHASVGEGSVVFTGAIVGHGCRIGPCCVLAPGAVINARVKLEEGVYVGTNASVLPELRLGAWATVGANSAVMEDLPPGATAMGVPAQVLSAAAQKRPAGRALSNPSPKLNDNGSRSPRELDYASLADFLS